MARGTATALARAERGHARTARDQDLQDRDETGPGGPGRGRVTPRDGEMVAAWRGEMTVRGLYGAGLLGYAFFARLSAGSRSCDFFANPHFN